MFRHMRPTLRRHPDTRLEVEQRQLGRPRRPAYCPGEPSERTTRWHGSTSGSGLSAHAVPTARTARGLPARAAICRVARGAPVGDVGQVQDDRRGGSRAAAAGRAARRTWSAGPRSTRRARGRRRRAAPGASSTRGLTASASACEHGVVVLDRERDAHQPGGRAREQQRADRAVDGAVGDVEQAVRARRVPPASRCSRVEVVRVPRTGTGRRRSSTPPGRSPGRSGAGSRRRRRRRAGRPRRCRRRARRRRRRAGRRGGGRRRRAAAWSAGRPAPTTGRGRGRRAAAGRSGTSATGTACRAARRTTSIALRCAIVTSQASTLASAGQVGVGAQGGQERLRPGVVGVDRADDRAADAQHGGAVDGTTTRSKGSFTLTVCRRARSPACEVRLLQWAHDEPRGAAGARALRPGARRTGPWWSCTRRATCRSAACGRCGCAGRSRSARCRWSAPGASSTSSARSTSTCGCSPTRTPACRR